MTKEGVAGGVLNCGEQFGYGRVVTSSEAARIRKENGSESHAEAANREAADAFAANLPLVRQIQASA